MELSIQKNKYHFSKSSIYNLEQASRNEMRKQLKNLIESRKFYLNSNYFHLIKKFPLSVQPESVLALFLSEITMKNNVKIQVKLNFQFYC